MNMTEVVNEYKKSKQNLNPLITKPLLVKDNLFGLFSELITSKYPKEYMTKWQFGIFKG